MQSGAGWWSKNRAGWRNLSLGPDPVIGAMATRRNLSLGPGPVIGGGWRNLSVGPGTVIGGSGGQNLSLGPGPVIGVIGEEAGEGFVEGDLGGPA